RESMKQLARRTKGDAGSGWPDFSDFECSSCHHDLVTPSARQERGYIARAGIPAWNESRYIVFRTIVGVLVPSQQKTLDDLASRLKREMENGPKARVQVGEVASNIASLMDRMIPQLEKISVDRQVTSRILQSIAAESENIARAGIRS